MTHSLGKPKKFDQQKLEAHDEFEAILTAALQIATAETGAAVEVVEVNDTGERFTLRPRFDFGAFAATAEEQLPAGFHLDRYHDDGAIDVVWGNAINEPDDSVDTTTVTSG